MGNWKRIIARLAACMSVSGQFYGAEERAVEKGRIVIWQASRINRDGRQKRYVGMRTVEFRGC